MTSVLEYTLYGEPLPWARTGARGGQRFTPKRIREAMSRHREAAELAEPQEWPMHARYTLEVVAYRGTARRCDVDNLGKLVLDALNRHAFIDDSQVERLVVEKHMDRAEPRTEVRLIVRAALESPVLRGGAV